MRSYFYSKASHIFINVVIFLNAVVLGLMTRQDLDPQEYELLERIDDLCLCFFCIEIILRFLLERLDFFRDPWNCFDMGIIGVALLSSMNVFSIGRALRVFKILKTISNFQSFRIVVHTVLSSLSKIGGIVAFLLVIFYVFAILGNQLFGQGFEVFFGSFSKSMFTLFQVMTLDAWSDQIARPILDVYPFSWIYFLAFIFITTIVILNVVIGLICETVNHVTKFERIRELEEGLVQNDDLLHEIHEIQLHLEKLDRILTKGSSD